MSASQAATRLVGVDLQDNEDNWAVVQAIQEDNADAQIRHLPGLVKIQVPGQLIITRETVEKIRGRDWETHEFQMAIISYYGNIDDWDDDKIVIKWRH